MRVLGCFQFRFFGRLLGSFSLRLLGIVLGDFQFKVFWVLGARGLGSRVKGFWEDGENGVTGIWKVWDLAFRVWVWGVHSGENA